MNKYIGLFAPAEHQTRVGESSIWYLYSKVAATEIHSFCPDARIIIMLRNPVDVMYAYHSQRLHNGIEDIPDFTEALKAEGDRKIGKRLPKYPWPVFGLFYREIVRFSDQVARYLDVFHREQVKIVIFDDFIADPSGEYRDVLRFSGVDSEFKFDTRPVNQNKTYRILFVGDLVYCPSTIIPGKVRAIVPRAIQDVVVGLIRGFNTKVKPRRPLPLEVRMSLEAQFAAEIRALSGVVGRDLMSWAFTTRERSA